MFSRLTRFTVLVLSLLILISLGLKSDRQASGLDYAATFAAPLQAPTIETLTSGSPVTGFIVAPTTFGNGVLGEKQYLIRVPSGTTQLRVELSGNQDVNLYVRFNQVVTGSGTNFAADHGATGPTGGETLTITPQSNPPLRVGDYFIGVVNNGGGAANFTLTATVTGGINPGNSQPINSGQTVGNGIAPSTNGSGVLADPQYIIQVPNGATQLQINMSGDPNQDLFVRFNEPVAQSPAGTNNFLTTYRTSIVNGAASLTINAASSPPLQAGSYFIAVANFRNTNSGFSLTPTTSVNPACTFSIAPTSQAFAGTGGTGSVTVTTQAGCTWTAVSNDNWLSITAGSHSSGPGTVNFSVASSPTNRTGSLTIAGQTFTVTQTGSNANCTFSIAPTSQSFSSTGGTGSVAVTTQTGCTWTAVSNDSWLTITAGASGTGNGMVNFSVAATTVTRTGTMTIAGQTFTVTQTAPTACTFAIAPTSQTFAATGGTGSIAVATQTGCAWTAVSNASWLTVTAGASGTGSGTVSFSAAANTGASRTGTLSVAGQIFTVTQTSGGSCTFSIAPTNQTFAATGGTGTVAVTTQTGCAWTATSNATWLTITVGSSGTGSGTIIFSVAASTDSNRTGTLTIAGQTFTVTQTGAASCTFTITPTLQNFTAAGGTGSVVVSTQTGCAWTAASNVPWATITAGATGTGNGTVTFTVSPSGQLDRTGTLTIAGRTFTINQLSGCSFSITPITHFAGSNPTTGSIEVSAPLNCSWTAVSNAPWLTITSLNSGIGNGGITYAIAANTGATRVGTISLAGQTFTVNQTGTGIGGVNCPTVTGFSPSTGTAGTTVTISGTNFTGVTGVRFGGNVAGSFNVINDSQIVVTVPAGVQSGALVISRPGCPETATNAFTVASCTATIPVAISPSIIASPGASLTVPVTVGDLTGRNIVAYDFTLTFDPAILRLRSTPFDLTSTLSNGLTVVANTAVAGQLTISAFGTTPLVGSGTLLNLNFDFISTALECSNLTWASFRFNEGNPCAATTAGRICRSGPVLSGAVNYCVQPKAVPGVVLNAVGTPARSATTNSGGLYQMTELGTGAYTVTPSKTGDVNGISAFDASLVAQHAAGLSSLSACQQLAADASNSGGITSFDAALIVQTLLGLPNEGIVGTWKFTPANRAYLALTADQINQNFDAVLVGDVSGNWAPTQLTMAAESSTAASLGPIAVFMLESAGAPNSTVTIPVKVTELTGQNIFAYDFELTFDPTVLQLLEQPVDTAGTLSNGFTVMTNTLSPGRVRLAGYGISPLSGTGSLLNLRFRVLGGGNGSTALNWQRFRFNEGEPQVTTVNSRFSLGNPCDFTLGSASESFAAAGGNGSVTIDAAGGCNWTASSNVAWLSISGGASGTGSGSVAFTVAPNISTQARTGFLIVASAVIKITQAGGTLNHPPPMITRIKPTTIKAGSGGFTLVVSGRNFVRGASILWNGAKRRTIVKGRSQLRASIPAADIAAPGTITITVVNPSSAGGGVSNAGTLVIIP